MSDDREIPPPRNGEVAAQPPEGPGAKRPVLATSGKTIRLAKALRKTMSPAETRLWVRLRGRKGAERWRNQHPCGPYTLDFFNPGAGLCVEVDGFAHNTGDRPARDEQRDAWLAAEGITVIRIAADEAMRDPDGVADAILQAAAVHRASRGPSVSR